MNSIINLHLHSLLIQVSAHTPVGVLEQTTLDVLKLGIKNHPKTWDAEILPVLDSGTKVGKPTYPLPNQCKKNK